VAAVPARAGGRPRRRRSGRSAAAGPAARRARPAAPASARLKVPRPPAKRPTRRPRALRWLAAAALLAGGSWGALALWYQGPPQPAARALIVAAWVAGTAAALRPAFAGRAAAALLWSGAFALLLAWWNTLQPSHARAWAD